MHLLSAKVLLKSQIISGMLGQFTCRGKAHVGVLQLGSSTYADQDLWESLQAKQNLLLLQNRTAVTHQGMECFLHSCSKTSKDCTAMNLAEIIQDTSVPCGSKRPRLWSGWQRHDEPAAWGGKDWRCNGCKRS